MPGAVNLYLFCYLQGIGGRMQTRRLLWENGYGLIWQLRDREQAVAQARVEYIRVSAFGQLSLDLSGVFVLESEATVGWEIGPGSSKNFCNLGFKSAHHIIFRGRNRGCVWACYFHRLLVVLQVINDISTRSNMKIKWNSWHMFYLRKILNVSYTFKY